MVENINVSHTFWGAVPIHVLMFAAEFCSWLGHFSEVTIRPGPQLIGLGRLLSVGMEQLVGSEGVDRPSERQSVVEAEPFAGVAVPLDVEAVAADPIEPDEGRVELFAKCFRKARAVALNEAMLGAVPFAEDVDRIVELGRSYGRQEAGLIEVLDQVLAGRGNRGFFCR